VFVRKQKEKFQSVSGVKEQTPVSKWKNKCSEWVGSGSTCQWLCGFLEGAKCRRNSTRWRVHQRNKKT